MVAPTGTTQKYVNPMEDNYGADVVFTDIYTNPDFVEPFGGGTAPMKREGNIDRSILPTAGVSPGATAADNVLYSFSIPAGTFDKLGRGITITASGKFAANGNTKQLKVIFNPATAVVGSTVGAGGTTVADSGAQTGSGVGWFLSANVFKLGAAGSNTQFGQSAGGWVGGTHLGGGAGSLPTYPTAVESGAILIAVTGNATTTATDIVLNFVEVNAMN